jgi:hypothetical protein
MRDRHVIDIVAEVLGCFRCVDPKGEIQTLFEELRSQGDWCRRNATDMDTNRIGPLAAGL